MKKIIALFLTFLMLFSFSSCGLIKKVNQAEDKTETTKPSDSENQTCEVNITVLEEGTDAPIKDAIINVFSGESDSSDASITSCTTDKDGKAKIILGYGIYQIALSHDLYQSETVLTGPIKQEIVYLDTIYMKSTNSVPSINLDAYKYELKMWNPEGIYVLPEYTLYDINKDGIPELIVKVYDMIHIYTIDNEQSKKVNKDLFLYSSYPGYLYEDPEGGLIIWSGGEGSNHAEYLSRYILDNNGQLIRTDDIFNTEKNGATYQDIQDEIATLTPINDFYLISDYSLLENYK